MTVLIDPTRGLAPGRGPLLTAADPADTTIRRRLERAWVAGELVRLTPAMYVARRMWLDLPAWERVILCAAALSATRPDTVFTGLTAATLHGLPVAVQPPALEIRAASRSHHGTRPLTPRPYSPALLAQHRVPRPPVRRPRWGLPTAAGHEPVLVDATLKDGRSLGTVAVDPLPTLVAVLGAATAFRDAIAPLDRLALDRPEEFVRWAAEAAESLPTSAARRRFDRAWRFADARAESAGESYSRALIHELGFAPPTALQHRHFDSTGREVARTDFWWEDAGIYGEFDGIGKYDLSLYDGDDDARRASIRREKEREVALQLVTRDGAHWTWADLESPDRLARILMAAGVPRVGVPRAGSAGAAGF